MAERNEDLIERWLDWLRGGNLSPNTVRLRSCMIHVFTAADRDLTAVTGDDVQRFLASRPGGAWSKAGYLSTLRSFYHYSRLTQALDHDPTVLVHAIRVPAGVPKPVPESVLQRALLLADEQTRFMLLLGAYAGLRRNEIATLHSRNVAGGQLVITGKGGRTRVIPVHPRLRPYLDFDGWAFPSERRPGNHLHSETVSNRICEALGPYTAHALRHAFATKCYAATHDIRAVQELLGHSSPTTTAKYTDSGYDAKAAAVLAVA